MKIAIALILGASTSVAPMTATWAQFVKGNEAVFQTASGRKVETPPVTASIGKPCAAAAHCHAGAWNMVETADGLAECTEPSARPTTCRPSTYGTQKLPRLWVVKRGVGAERKLSHRSDPILSQG